MIRRILPLLVAVVFAASAQKTGSARKYNGPVPPKPDLPYLKHANNLVPTEAVDVKEDKKTDEITYIIPGATSSARTPLAAPIFLFQADKIAPDRLGLYRLESRNGRREIATSPKKPLEPIRIVVRHLSGNLYQIEVDDSIEAGEYALTPEGRDLAFCFQVF
jgi:hypothetical protein